MSVMYCLTCDRYVDTDDEMGCERCLENGLSWCWACSRGYEKGEHHPNEAEHRKDNYVEEWNDE